MRTLSLLLALLILGFYQTSVAQSLQVSENGRYLQTTDGTPFFYLGDTAWELFHRLDREEARHYLMHRARLGFTVIQAVVLAEREGLDDPNPYGAVPLENRDPNRPNEAYFEHVDFIVNLADSLGLVVGMLPTWGSYWSSLNPDRVIFDEDNAGNFGRFLGERYRENSIIWILGGDHNIHTPEERRIIEAMAAGIKEGDQGRHLMTYHPRGPGLSSDYFHEAEWLDFNMYQSSHGGHDHDNGLYAERDYALSPTKPTLDGEPRYEMIPVGFYFTGMNRMDRFDDYDARQAAYWSILAGACGHTYGHNSVWQMWAPGREAVLGAVHPWYEALDHPGAYQMGILRKFFASIPFHTLAPNQSLLPANPDGPGAKVRVASNEDNSLIIAYSPRGMPFTLNLTPIPTPRNKASWFDPRYGVTYQIHTGDTEGIQTFTPPTSGRGRDWILVLEGAVP